MTTCDWSAHIEVRDHTVVALIWSGDDAAGRVLEQALAAAAGETGGRALLVGPFYVEKLEIPSWYGRIGMLGADAPLLARMARAVLASLQASGCHVDDASARLAA